MIGHILLTYDVWGVCTMTCLSKLTSPLVFLSSHTNDTNCFEVNLDISLHKVVLRFPSSSLRIPITVNYYWNLGKIMSSFTTIVKFLTAQGRQTFYHKYDDHNMSFGLKILIKSKFKALIPGNLYLKRWNRNKLGEKREKFSCLICQGTRADQRGWYK